MSPRLTSLLVANSGATTSTFVEATTTPATGAVAMYQLKTALKAKAWTVLSSSDGTTYNSSGDQITSGGGGAGGLANEAAWFRIADPDGGVEYVIQRQPGGDNTSWNVWLSKEDGFTGGTPDATTIPTATDGGVVFSDANLFHADGTYDVTIGVQDAAPWMWYLYTDDGDVGLMHIPTTGTGNPTVFVSGQLSFTNFARIEGQENAVANVVTMMSGLLCSVSTPTAPWSILGLSPYLWLHADLGIVLGAVGVATWQDQSGNGRHFSTVTSSREPAQDPVGINGHPALSGDGVNTLLTAANFTGAAETGSVDVFIVFRLRYPDGSGGFPTTGLGGAWQLGSPGGQEDYPTYAVDTATYLGLFSTARKSTGLTLGAYYWDSAKLLEVHSAANDWRLLVNGTELYSTGTNTVSNGAASTPAVFGDPDAAGVRMNGWIGEVLVFAPSLSDANRALVRAELTARWGL